MRHRRSTARVQQRLSKSECGCVSFIHAARGKIVVKNAAALSFFRVFALRVQGVSSTALRMVSVGQAPPDFKLMNQVNKPVSLSSFKKKKKVVVSLRLGAACHEKSRSRVRRGCYKRKAREEEGA